MRACEERKTRWGRGEERSDESAANTTTSLTPFARRRTSETYTKFVSKAASTVTTSGLIVQIGGIDKGNVVSEGVTVFKTADEVCASTDHTFVVSKCDDTNKRQKEFRWLDASGLPADKPGTCVEVTSTYALPSSVEVPCSYVMPTSSHGSFVTTLAFVGATYIFISLGMLILLKRAPIIKMSQPPFVAMSLIGCAGMCLSNLTNLGEMTDASCTNRVMAFNLCYTLMFAPIFAKTYRVYKVVNNVKLKKVSTDMTTMLIAVTMIIIFDIILLVVWEMVDPEKAVDEESGTPGVFNTVCKSDGSVSLLNIAYKVALTCYGSYIR